MVRSYKHKHKANINKVLIVEDIYRSYKLVCASLVNKQCQSILKIGNISKSNKVYQPINSDLSERYKDIAHRQVQGIMSSWLANIINNFNKIVHRSSLSKETKTELYKIAKYHLWTNLTHDKYSDTNLKLARKIIKKCFKHYKLPSCKNIQMMLNTKVFKLSKSNITEHNGYWIRLSTKKRGELIDIPLSLNPYFESKNGVILKGVNVIFKNNKLTDFVLIKDTQKNPIKHKTDIIGLDFGLCNLLTSSRGDLFGRSFLDKLRKYDQRYQNLIKEYKRNKIVNYKEQKRFKRLNGKIKGYIKNEVNRVLNRVIELYGPKTIVMENLNFMGSKLGKQLNRLLHRCGLSQIKVKLDCLKQEHDIEIKHVYPAYTSQTCSKCQYVDKTNRKNQAIFQCKCCHKKINADVNASRNLVRRSNQTGFYDYITLNNISSLLVNQFIKNNFVNKKSRIISYQSLTELVDKNPLKGFYLTAMKLH